VYGQYLFLVYSNICCTFSFVSNSRTRHDPRSLEKRGMRFGHGERYQVRIEERDGLGWGTHGGSSGNTFSMGIGEKLWKPAEAGAQSQTNSQEEGNGSNDKSVDIRPKSTCTNRPQWNNSIEFNEANPYRQATKGMALGTRMRGRGIVPHSNLVHTQGGLSLKA
jgi:hypothetical protein